MQLTGYAEGEVCEREGCAGHIAMHEPDGCSCHISPPCSACTKPRNYCPVCDWEEADEPVEPVAARPAPAGTAWWNKPMPTLADLDRTKISWLSKSHSSCSMIKQGVFPIGTPREEVRKEVDGTFGGRFDYFDENKGEFRFIAYTD